MRIRRRKWEMKTRVKSARSLYSYKTWLLVPSFSLFVLLMKRQVRNFGKIGQTWLLSYYTSGIWRFSGEEAEKRRNWLLSEKESFCCSFVLFFSSSLLLTFHLVLSLFLSGLCNLGNFKSLVQKNPFSSANPVHDVSNIISTSCLSVHFVPG